MSNINDVYGGGFLKADDLKGKIVPVTIERAEIKEFEDAKKIILHFVGKDKALVVNKTNASIIAENIGSEDTDDWDGKAIKLCTKKVEYAGKLVPAIRVVLEEKQPVEEQAEGPDIDF